MALQLSQIRDEVKANLGNRTDISDTRIDRIINLMVRRLSRRFNFEELETSYSSYTTTVGDADVAIADITGGPSELKKIYDLYLTLSDRTYQPKWLSPHQFFESKRHDSGVDNQTPFMFTVFGLNVLFHRPPDDVYTVHLFAIKYPDTMSNDTDTCDIVGKDEAIIALTTSWFYISLGETDRSNMWFRIFKEEMDSIIKNELQERRPDINAERPTVGTLNDYYADPFVGKMP